MADNAGIGTGSSGITGTPGLAASPTAYAGASSQLGAAIQTIWSKEILFQAMPILRMEAFAVKKTELGVQPGLTINFMRYSNLPVGDQQLTEGVRMDTNSLTAWQFSITVAEHGYAIAVSELLLNASFDDVMASASRLLGRNMAQYLDNSARDTMLQGSSVIYGYQPPANGVNEPYGIYNPGTRAANRAGLTGSFFFTPPVVKDAVETLASKNIPRLGETYVCFVHPHQSRRLRDTPEFIEVTKYASPGNFLLGEIGRLNDVVFIETTQVKQIAGGGGSDPVWQSIFIGDNAFGHAISLPVELRDGGVLDFGREHALSWYSIWGLGLITDNAVVVAETN
jgi:N4-gp56 family major capsid protein